MSEKISGFTFVRNAIKYDYPVIESLRSLSFYCDEVIVAVGKSEDQTLEIISNAGITNLKIIETVWDDSVRHSGAILAEQTNIALAHTSHPWCLYLQADEVLHEADRTHFREMIAKADKNNKCEGLLFQWRHFFGNYQWIGTGRQWYRREVRAFKNDGNVFSWGDAQGFRTKDNQSMEVRKLRVLQTKARVFHYGWVRHPRIQQLRQREFNKLWHSDEWISQNIPDVDEYNYQTYELEKFQELHPSVMKERIEKADVWASRFDASRCRKKPFFVKLSDSFEKATGVRIGEYKNFEEISF